MMGCVRYQRGVFWLEMGRGSEEDAVARYGCGTGKYIVFLLRMIFCSFEGREKGKMSLFVWIGGGVRHCYCYLSLIFFLLFVSPFTPKKHEEACLFAILPFPLSQACHAIKQPTTRFALCK